jgi:hypothetical protein
MALGGVINIVSFMTIGSAIQVILMLNENELEAPSSVTNKWIYFQLFESFTCWPISHMYNSKTWGIGLVMTG